jgi:starch synthase
LAAHSTMTALSVLSVASEIFPLVKTGGLADVVGALPGALQPEGVRIVSCVPGYPAVLGKLAGAGIVHSYDDLFGGPARILMGEAAGLAILALDAPHLFDRPGNPYSGPDGQDWPDNAFRFAALGRAAADIGLGSVAAFRPDIVHLHDWQAGMAAAYLRYAGRPRPGLVTTVHNMAFQGHVPAYLLGLLGLPPEAFALDGVEYYGSIGMLKSALLFADRVTTVSPTYAREIQSPDAGMGLEGLLRTRASTLSGILNGIDTDVWDPATDPMLPAHFGAEAMAGRARTRRLLQDRLGLSSVEEAPIFGIVSRLTSQKGLDLVLAALPDIIASGGQIALLGSGETAIESGFRAAIGQYPGKVGCQFGYDEALAHLIQAGSDFILVPSRFEPCGLTQLCALRYGAVPLVARVGGLADSVIDANEMALGSGVATGIQFAPTTQDALDDALRRAFRLYADKPAFRRIQANGMATDVSWATPARRYAALYRTLMASRA